MMEYAVSNRHQMIDKMIDAPAPVVMEAEVKREDQLMETDGVMKPATYSEYSSQTVAGMQNRWKRCTLGVCFTILISESSRTSTRSRIRRLC